MSTDRVSMEDLTHHGVKGMHWGSRKSSGSSGGSSGGSGGAKSAAPAKTKPSVTDIRDARKRISRKDEDVFDAHFDLKRTTERGSKAREAGMKELQKTKLSYLKDPDRATALRMTKGEKAAAAVVAASPFIVVTPVGLAFTAGVGVVTAGRVIARKAIEKKQASGAYDKKN